MTPLLPDPSYKAQKTISKQLVPGSDRGPSKAGPQSKPAGMDLPGLQQARGSAGTEGSDAVEGAPVFLSRTGSDRGLTVAVQSRIRALRGLTRPIGALYKAIGGLIRASRAI